MFSVFSFLNSEKVNTNQGCTTNSRLMRYYVLPLERARLALRKSYYFLALHYGGRWTIFPIAETEEISDKGFQMVLSGPLNFETIHYCFKGLSWLRDIPGDFSFPALCCFKKTPFISHSSNEPLPSLLLFKINIYNVWWNWSAVLQCTSITMLLTFIYIRTEISQI